MKEDIIKICDEIRINNKCNGCGGGYDNHTCRYCGNDSQILKKLIDELNLKLDNLKEYDYDILNALYSIKTVNIRIVNDLIKKTNYEEELKDRYEYIFDMVMADKLGKYGYHQLIYFIDNNLFIGDNNNYLINYLMKKLLTFELVELDINDILILIKRFTEMFLSNNFSNPICSYEKLDEGTLGEAFLKFITLDKDSIIKMIKIGDFEGLLELVFHECTHTTQNYASMVSKKVSYNILTQSKERILKGFITDYYNNNYDNYNAEVEARYCGAYLTMWYLNTLGVPVINMEYFKNIMVNEEVRVNNDKRIVDGVETSLDELFSTYVIDVRYLEYFPILNVQYKNDNGKMVLKSREELLSDYDRYKNGELSLNGTNDDIEILYDKLLKSSKNKNNSI